jgi:hypothetical protein
MERPSWSKAITGVLKQEDTASSATVLARYDRLISQLREASQEQVSDWELGEALNLRAMFLERRGRFREAFAGYEAVAALRRGHLVSNGHSLASALEAAVLAAIRAGQRKKALAYAHDVIKLRGEYPYASRALEQVVKLLHDEQMRRSALARRQQLRRGKRAEVKARRRPTKG